MSSTTPAGVHRRRIRRHARLITIFAHLVVPIVGAWFFFGILACTGGQGGGLMAEACERGFALPAIPFALVLFFAAFLCQAIWAFAADRSEAPRAPNVSLIVHYSRRTGDGYRALEDEERQAVAFAFEMLLWSSSVILGTLLFYYTEVAWPLGVLAMLAGARLIFAMGKRLVSRVRSR